MRTGGELAEEGLQTRLVCDRAPRRLLADLPRARAERQLHRLHRPTRLRRRAHDRRRPDRRPTSTATLDRVEIIYNAYISPLTQQVTRETLLPLSHATIAGEERGADEAAGGEPASDRETARARSSTTSPSPEEILKRLVPDYVEISIYRALVESTAGFFGAQMTAMRSASENAGEIITDYTLQMNRARQAEITQEIMEVVAGAEGLS